MAHMKTALFAHKVLKGPQCAGITQVLASKRGARINPEVKLKFEG